MKQLIGKSGMILCIGLVNQSTKAIHLHSGTTQKINSNLHAKSKNEIGIIVDGSDEEIISHDKDVNSYA